MPHRFDATLKDLAHEAPSAFLTAFDVNPTLPISLPDVDLSVVSKAADLVIGLGDPLREIVLMEFQTRASANKHADVLVYNALLYRRYLLPIHSIVILLRPEAAHSNLNGQIHYAPRPGRGSMTHKYEVVRLWEQPVDGFLKGDLLTLPLAPLARMPDGLPVKDAPASVIRQVVERLERDAPVERRGKLASAAFVLICMRISPEQARPLFEEVFAAMHESPGYQWILDEGREEEARKLLLRAGQKRFGMASEALTVRIQAIEELDRLENLFDRVFDVSGWEELLEE